MLSPALSERLSNVSFDPQLIVKYDQFGPRYTSYPTADRFSEAFRTHDLVAALLAREPRPLSLYVHVPFCDTICYYCACNKVITKDHGRAAKYVRYLGREIAMVAELVDTSSPVRQLHWGGGTPTFLAPEEMTTLMAELRAAFGFAPAEIRSRSIRARSAKKRSPFSGALASSASR